MTRKDYKLIAEVLRIAWGQGMSDDARYHVERIVENTATELARVYPNFDRQKFLEAIQ